MLVTVGVSMLVDEDVKLPDTVLVGFSVLDPVRYVIEVLVVRTTTSSPEEDAVRVALSVARDVDRPDIDPRDVPREICESNER